MEIGLSNEWTATIDIFNFLRSNVFPLWREEEEEGACYFFNLSHYLLLIYFHT